MSPVLDGPCGKLSDRLTWPNHFGLVGIEIALVASWKSLLFLFAICFAVYASPCFMSTKLTVSNEIGIDTFSTLLAEHGRLKYRPKGDQIFGLQGFVPQQSVYKRSGEALLRQYSIAHRGKLESCFLRVNLSS